MDNRMLDDLAAQLRADQLSRRTFIHARPRARRLRDRSCRGLGSALRLRHGLQRPEPRSASRHTTGSAAPTISATLTAWASRATG